MSANTLNWTYQAVKMRYKQIADKILHPHLKWVHFDGRRPWLDTKHPKIILTLQFFGKGVRDLNIAAHGRDGTALPCRIFGAGEPVAGRQDYEDRPIGLRSRVRLRVDFPAEGPVTLYETDTGTELLSLDPQIVYPAFLFDLVQELHGEFAPDILKNFVETGTLFGHTALHASYWFDTVTTIELASKLHAMARSTLAHRDNITCVRGNSAEALPRVIQKLDGPSVFFLDAHWSGDATVDWGSSPWGGYPVDTAQIEDTDLENADRQVPLMQELKTIATDHAAPAIVLIDDWAAIGQTDNGFKGEDWRNLDRRTLTGWMTEHPRTRRHFPLDAKRYVWVLNAS